MRNVSIWLAAACLLGAVGFVAGCGRKAQAPASEHAGEKNGHDEAAHGAAAEKSAQGEDGHGQEEASAERVELSAETRAASGITVGIVGGHTIQRTLTLPGEIVPNADRLAHIVPRFPGIAREVRKQLGDAVRQGEVLAVVEGNQSLSNYEVTSLISGTVIERHVTLGEFVRDDADLFVIADLSTVWVNVSVYGRDIHAVRRGQSVRIEDVASKTDATGRIDYVGPIVGEETRAANARVVIANRGRLWKPGQFVTARIAIETASVPVAVPDVAIQRVEGKEAVFVEDGDGFVARPIVRGRTDGDWTEIVSGLRAGERIAMTGSFVLKSELQKSEAGHEH